jgi:formylglycine-generating enzyme required for sulfatase activity
MSETVVTVGQFRKFVEGGKYVTLAEKLGGDSDSTNPSKPGSKAHFWSAPGGANGYRLPTEAQWEFACRAGTTTQYWFGDDPEELAAYGWCVRNSGGAAHAVAQKPANPFRLYDMHGNVEEWCADWLDDKYYDASPARDPTGPAAGSGRAVRGGRWLNLASICRCALRHGSPGPALRLNLSGFRVVRGG